MESLYKWIFFWTTPVSPACSRGAGSLNRFWWTERAGPLLFWIATPKKRYVILIVNPNYIYIYIDFRISILELKKTLHLHHQDPLQAKLHIPMARHFVRFSLQWRTTRWWTNSWPNIVRPRPWPQAWPLGDISCCWWFWGLMWLNGKSHIIDTVIYG